MVRESIARHTGTADAAGEGGPHPGSPRLHDHRHHPSFTMLPLARGGDGDGACLIEPSVRCNHCGYCLAYGH